jgi:hypothetical protein
MTDCNYGSRGCPSSLAACSACASVSNRWNGFQRRFLDGAFVSVTPRGTPVDSIPGSGGEFSPVAGEGNSFCLLVEAASVMRCSLRFMVMALALVIATAAADAQCAWPNSGFDLRGIGYSSIAEAAACNGDGLAREGGTYGRCLASKAHWV